MLPGKHAGVLGGVSSRAPSWGARPPPGWPRAGARRGRARRGRRGRAGAGPQRRKGRPAPACPAALPSGTARHGAGMGRTVVELFYDVISPYSWLAFEVRCRQREGRPSPFRRARRPAGPAAASPSEGSPKGSSAASSALCTPKLLLLSPLRGAWASPSRVKIQGHREACPS